MVSDDERDEVPELRDYLHVLRRRVVLVVSGLVLGLAVGALWWSQQPERYTATAAILLRPIVRDAFQVGAPLDRSIDADTERRVLLSVAVAETAGQALSPARSAEEMVAGVTATQPGDLLLRVAFSAAEPALARDGAQAFADAYLERRRNAAEEALELARRPLADRLEGARAELTQVLARLAAQRAAPDPDELTVIEAETRRTVLTAVIQDLERDLVSLDQIDLDGGEVLDRALLPSAPSTPTLPRLLVIGGVVGLLLGTVGAFTRDRLEDRLVDPTRDLPPLALPVVGQLPGGKKALDDGAAEAFRALRDRLAAADAARPSANGARHGGTVTMFTAAEGAPRSGSVAGQFASALSAVGPDVLLVRADLRDGPAGDRAGLAEVLAGTAELGDAVWIVDSPTPMARLDSGTARRDPSDLLQADALEAFFTEARRRYRHVVVDAPPALPHADDLALARFADAIVVCVQPRVTDLPTLRRAVTQLRDAGGTVTGAIVIGG